MTPDSQLSFPFMQFTLQEKLQRAIEPIKSLYRDQAYNLQEKRALSTCFDGCAHCCNQLFSISVIEAIYALSYYVQLGSGSLMSLSTATAWRVALGKMDNWDPQKWFGLKMPCVFLKDNSCSIYVARPWVCRAYYVRSDPNLCAMGKDVNVLVGGREKTHYTDAILDSIKELPLPYGRIPMALALQWGMIFMLNGMESLNKDVKRVTGEEVKEGEAYYYRGVRDE